MLAVMLLSQHRVLSSKTVRPRTLCGAQCIRHAVSTWSADCSEAPHSQFDEGARPHLCMDKWNHPTPVHSRLSLTQAAQGKPIPTGLALVPGTKTRSLEAFSQHGNIKGQQAFTQYDDTLSNKSTLEYHKVEFCLQNYLTFTPLTFHSP